MIYFCAVLPSIFCVLVAGHLTATGTWFLGLPFLGMALFIFPDIKKD